MTLRVFHDHDRVVHHYADREHQPEERQRVNGKIHDTHEDERADERNGNADRWNQRRAPVLEEDKYDQYHESDGLEERSVDFVDGGIVGNFPIWIFRNDNVDTIGFILRDLTNNDIYRDVSGPIDYGGALIDTCIDGIDRMHIDEEDWLNRVIIIDTFGISSTNFNIVKEQKDALYLSGLQATQDFFEQYKNGNKKLLFSESYKNKWKDF